jgi:hypothetical protein
MQRRLAVCFWDFLRPPTASKGKPSPEARPATSVALAEALAEARTAAASSAAHAAEVAERRQQLLLGGSDAQIDAVDAELATANRAVDKIEAAVAALEARLAEAEDAERAAAIDRIHADGAAALAAGLGADREYAALAPQVAGLARRMADAQAAIDQANARLRRAGDPRLVADLDAGARPNRSSYQTLRRPLWSVLVRNRRLKGTL